MTAVTAPHRGHRLGLLVKAAMHQWLVDAEPGVRRVVTSNSETNGHMIAINEALGYLASGWLRSWELSIPATWPAAGTATPGRRPSRVLAGVPGQVLAAQS